MSIYTKVASIAATDATIVGTTVLGAVTVDAALNPEIGDTKDYSSVIELGTNIGIGLSLSYLGIKYIPSIVKGSGGEVFEKANANQSKILAMLGGTKIP